MTVDFDTVGFRNMVGDCFDMLTAGKPVFKAYQCNITIPTKLTSTDERLLFLKIYSNLPLAVYDHTVGHTVILSVIQSYGHTVIQSFIQSYCRSYGNTVVQTVIPSFIQSYGHLWTLI